MLPWQRAPDNATSKYRNNSTLAKNDFGRLFLSRAQIITISHVLDSSYLSLECIKTKDLCYVVQLNNNAAQ